MAYWPFFGRKNSRGKRPKDDHRSSSPETTMHYTSAAVANAAQHEAAAQGGLQRDKSAKGARPKRTPSRETKKLQRRAMSFSPGRNDTIRVPRDIYQQHPVPAIPHAHRRRTEGMAPAAAGDANGDKEWQRVPTLHKRGRNTSPRRRSSKKRKEDHDREAEVKAMSFTVPTRAATEYGLAGRPMKKDSKRMKNGLGRNFTNPPSDISLPVAESLHSSMSSGSERRALYTLKGMDVLTPRPTIRYSENPRYAPGASGWGSDDESKKRRITNGPPIPEEVIKSKKRIDDLADELDAGDLRELMERDQRRRDRKKVSDQEKMQRRLTRRAQKLKAAEEEAARNGTPPPINMERGVMGRELIGLGIESDPVTSTRISSEASARLQEIRSSTDRDVEAETPVEATSPKPASNFQRTESLGGSEAGSPTEDREAPVLGTAKVARLSKASMPPPSSPKGHKRGASSISQMMELSTAPAVAPSVVPYATISQDLPVVKPVPSRTSSEASTGKGKQHHSWTNFFKRGSKQKRNSIPSSFSNTSRESTVVASQVPYAYTAKRASASSGVPKRTMSKFREDLPENRMPISPPDSRVQSPEADIVPPMRAANEKRTVGRGSMDNPSPFGEQSRVRYDTPTSGFQSLEAARPKGTAPIAIRRPDPSPEPVGTLSQSLASIDSEGSWLSGRPRAGSKRSSAQMVPHSFRESASSLQKRYNEYSDTEELGIAEDEYFGRLTPGPDEQFNLHSRRRASGQPMPSSDEEDGGSLGSPGERSKWGAVARQATVVQSETRAKSREGILNYFDDDDSGSETTPGHSPRQFRRRLSYESDERVKTDEPTLARATSVNLGKGHVRHLSAGSARLLDVKPRASGESKRTSVEPPAKRSGERLSTVEGEVM